MLRQCIFVTAFLGYLLIIWSACAECRKPRSDVWWGPGPKKYANTTISKFSINVSNKTLVELNQQLDTFLSQPLTPPLEGVQFQYGFNSDYLRTIIKYWRFEYNKKWKQREKLLNSLPQYTSVVNGLKMHFIHVVPKPAKGYQLVPILIMHGWPGSTREFYELIPRLTASNHSAGKFVFEIIAPSLPGFGFSEAAAKRGMGPVEMAVVLNNLMAQLGIRQYYVHGGDWGSVVAKIMGQLYPNRILGIHSNLCLADSSISALFILLGGIQPNSIVERKYQHLMYPLNEHFLKLMQQTGYFHLQATRPDTIGIALSHSAGALAAYILEKFSIGTNWAYNDLFDGGLTTRFSLDSLLDNVMIYWLTNSITTSMRLYAEYITPTEISYNIHEEPVNVPTACIRFHKDIFWQSTEILKLKFRKLIQITDVLDGGHFAAMENPSLLAQDIFSAVSKIIRYQNRKSWF